MTRKKHRGGGGGKKHRGGKKHKRGGGGGGGGGGGDGGRRGGRGGGGNNGGGGAKTVKRMAASGDLNGAVMLFCRDPGGCSGALSDLLEKMVKARCLAQGVQSLLHAAAAASQLSHTALRDVLLSMPVDAPPREGADFAEVATRMAGWDSEAHCMYFASKTRHAVLDFLEEASQTLERIRTEPPERRVQAGLSKIGVRFKEGMKSGELVVDGFGGAAMEEDRRGMVKGDSVGVQADGNWNWQPGLLEAEVLNERPLVIKFVKGPPPVPVTKEAGRFRIDKLANRQQYSRIIASLHLLAAPEGRGGNGESTRKVKMRPSRSIIEAVLTTGPGACSAAESRCAMMRSAQVDQARLNASQRRALEAAISQSMVLIQGPPGTGKTSLAVKILQQWARTGGGPYGGQVMAASDSNIAVDNIVEGVGNLGVDVVRLGRPETARPELLRHCADEIACKALGIDKLKDCTDKRRAHDVVHEAIKRARVVCTTAIGAGSAIIERYAFGRVLIDEASQATEIATIVPFCHGAEQVVLLGDHCQLPPTVSSDMAASEGLALSLFERLVQGGVRSHLLDTQYRMNPAISSFPRRLFYAGRLEDGIDGNVRPPLEGFKWPVEDMPVCLVTVTGRELGSGTSYENSEEAEMVVFITRGLLEKHSPQDVGIVTPYGAQVRLLRRLLQRAGVPVSFRGQSGVEVASVDGFQGREKEGIVMSTVRSSPSSGIGFVSDWRRANVAFTRARRGVIVVGNPSTLARDEGTWLPWLHWIQSIRCHLGQMPSLPPISPHAPKVGLSAAGSTLTSTPSFRVGLASSATATSRLAQSMSFRRANTGLSAAVEGSPTRRGRSRGRSSGSSSSSSDSGSDRSESSGSGRKASRSRSRGGARRTPTSGAPLGGLGCSYF